MWKQQPTPTPVSAATGKQRAERRRGRHERRAAQRHRAREACRGAAADAIGESA